MIVVVRHKDKSIIYKYMDNKTKQGSFGKCEIGNPRLTKHVQVPDEWLNRILKVNNDLSVEIDELAEYNELPWYEKAVTSKPKDE